MSKPQKKKWRPYVMRGRPTVTEFRQTAVDPPDQRVPEVPIPTLPAEAVRNARRRTAIDPRLRAVDLCFEQWAVSPNSDLAGVGYAHVILVQHQRSGTPPLDDLQSKIIDAVVKASPRWAERFVHLWYRSGLNVTDIAKELEIKHRPSVYTELELVLGYYLGRLHEIGFTIKVEPDA